MSVLRIPRPVVLLAVAVVAAGCESSAAPVADPAAAVLTIGSDAVDTDDSEHWSVRVYAGDEIIESAWIEPGERMDREVALDAGDYRIEARVQRCDGRCDRLLTEGQRACSVQLALSSGERVSLSVDRTDDGGCAFWVEG